MLGSPDSSAVDARMMRACLRSDRVESSIAKAIEHHLSAGGSRVRSNFSLQASLRLGVGEQDAVTLAAICELLHNASLIHDDLLDRAPIRRGAASVWAQFGDSVAICAGDLLLATSYSLVGELREVEFLPRALALVHQRTRDVIVGQDAEQSSAANTLEEYEKVAIGKSASLLSLPFELSLLLSGNEDAIANAQHAAEAFAVAYQMLDDLNDYAEDRRNGSLNAVAVAMDANDLEYDSAMALVCERAETLIARSMNDAARLPMESGAAMIAYAGSMQRALSALREAVPIKMEPSRHGG
jgi:geranylgeranyl pyrophosphate synthase